MSSDWYATESIPRGITLGLLKLEREYTCSTNDLPYQVIHTPHEVLITRQVCRRTGSGSS